MGKTYLIVDDSRLSRMMVKAIIDEYHPESEVIEAPDAESTLSTIGAGQVLDVALVDYNMPGMNGLDLFAALAKIVDIPKRALLTANIQNEIRQRTEAVGITFINKPIDEKTIREFIAS